jgi:hypothetical protein
MAEQFSMTLLANDDDDDDDDDDQPIRIIQFYRLSHSYALLILPLHQAYPNPSSKPGPLSATPYSNALCTLPSPSVTSSTFVI